MRLLINNRVKFRHRQHQLYNQTQTCRTVAILTSGQKQLWLMILAIALRQFGYACRAEIYSIQLLDWPEELGDCTIQELFLFYPQDDDPVFCPQDPNNDEAGVS
ncbi:hypothetical protein QC762_0029280 [Podospora pseudocomata]|uniref:Uncharacterized protein n=1 Tax=Podospora pseudocomata TaxID=2093779 RepID=A0ABR0GSB7_9PEZI|nr:hypothetical protein QC762_0029280 [Podospora pseudocomata]